MGSDAMDNSASFPSVVAGKKKRANRSAKLKQCKLDARREQWLSQVKEKDDCKLTGTAISHTSPHLVHPPRAWTDRIDTEIRAEEDEREGISLHACSDFDSPPAIENHRRRNTSRNNSISSRSSSLQSTSRSVSESEEDIEEKGDEKGVLDDWEEIADALCEDHGSDYHCRHHRRHHRDRVMTSVDPATSQGIPNEACNGGRTAKPESAWSSRRHWRLDNTSNPQSLLRKWSFPPSTEQHAERHYPSSRQKGILPLPISCPICCEDLDLTDSSFLPCSCGFRLCLFCHKRILETDGRCPGCRKQYDSIFERVGEINATGTALPVLQMRHF